MGQAHEHMLMGQPHGHMLMGQAHGHMLMGQAHGHMLMGQAHGHMLRGAVPGGRKTKLALARDQTKSCKVREHNFSAQPQVNMTFWGHPKEDNMTRVSALKLFKQEVRENRRAKQHVA